MWQLVCICGEEVKECKPWSGDVIEEVAKPIGASKTVGFSEPSEMANIEPRPEDDNAQSQDVEDGDSSSEASALGDSEAFDEEEDGVIDDDEWFLFVHQFWSQGHRTF